MPLTRRTVRPPHRRPSAARPSDGAPRHDVVVVGGGFAGMAAALQLVRARRDVLVVDAGERRNRVAPRAYGFLGSDGEDPAQIVRRARTQLAAYPTLTLREGTATHAEPDAADAAGASGFVVTLADGTRHRGARLVLALGITDALPDLPGVPERWGRGVFACPYCHGYELGRGPIAVVGSGPASLQQALLLTEWGPVTFFPDGSPVPKDAAAAFRDRGVAVERGRIAAVAGEADVVLRDGRTLPFAGVFVATTTQPSSPLAALLGCAMHETETGSRILTDDAKATSVPGVFACGDAACASHSLAVAVGDGTAAGIAVHRTLAFPPPGAAAAGAGERHGGRR